MYSRYGKIWKCITFARQDISNKLLNMATCQLSFVGLKNKVGIEVSTFTFALVPKPHPVLSYNYFYFCKAYQWIHLTSPQSFLKQLFYYIFILNKMGIFLPWWDLRSLPNLPKGWAEPASSQSYKWFHEKAYQWPVIGYKMAARIKESWFEDGVQRREWPKLQSQLLWLCKWSR